MTTYDIYHNSDNQEVIFQVTSAKEDTSGLLEYSRQATSVFFVLVSSVVMWQSDIWAMPRV